MRLKHQCRVGIRTCTLFLDTNSHFMKVEWDPSPPTKLTDQELDQYRKGRDELLAKAGEILGGSVVVIET